MLLSEQRLRLNRGKWPMTKCLLYPLCNHISHKILSRTGLRLNPVVISLAAAYLVAGTYSLLHNPQVDTFTVEEWMWGIRDGYFGQMLSTFMKHGGLPAVDPVQVVPFTPQEWWWSMRDGYVGDMIEQSWKNGGLVVSESVDDLAPTTILPEEWAWAVKDGYLSDMITHYFKHGGL